MSDAWSAPTGAPGTGVAAEFPDVFRNAQLIVRRGGMSLVIAYGAIAVALFVVQIPSWLFVVITSIDPGNGAIAVGGAFASLCWAIVQLGLTLALTTLSTGLARVARTLVVEPDAVFGAGSMLRMAATRYFAVFGALLLTGVLVVIGLCFMLLPGLIAAFFLSSAVYLVAATDIEFGAAFEKSYKLALANVPVLLAWFGAVFVFSLIIGAASFVGNLVFTGAGVAIGMNMDPDYAGIVMALGQIIGPMLTAAASAVLGFPLWVVSNGLLVAIETADAGIPAKEDV